MNPDCLRHSLTDAERDAFERDGYFSIPNALTADQVAHFANVVEETDAAHRRTNGLRPEERVNLHDAIGADARFLDLIDWPTTFPKVWGILGWNIQLYHTQLVVSPQLPPSPKGKRWGWHQDNNRMNRDMEVALQPRVSLKVLFFLNDIPTVGMGNFYVLPGSHTVRQLPPPISEEDPNPQGALGITAKAGDALIFDRRLWHAASENTSPVTRKVLFYGYSYRWLRPKCDMDLSRVWEDCDPIRRQLLGDRTTAGGYFDPQPGDVPLREWIAEYAGSERVCA
jgi:ectoine hydroxylase-related dioxygenase (phytanoyl-CoA dioxygenase family)